MTRVSLSLLGGFEATLDGVPVTAFESDKVRALLAYLAVEYDRPQRREHLAGLLWPDMPDRDARTNLRHVLANLRAVLNDRDTEQPFLLASRQTIQCNAESDFDLDVKEFTDAIAATTTHSHANLEACETCIARLREAANLYTGDFFAGFSLDSDLYEAWTTVQRERLHIQALDALDTLAVYHEQRGDHTDVIRYAQRQVELEPWRESAHRQWMRALAHSGQRGMALAQYETCRRILEAELGIEPETATTALYESIRRGDLQPQPESLPIPQPAPEVLPTPSRPISPAPEGERRIVTLLLADVRGTATGAHHIDTETWAETITPALHLLGTEITRLGGNVEHYRRDGLTACFGGQVAHEDDPERAVLAALAMQEVLSTYLAEINAADLNLTVSVHTGEVILSPVGETVSLLGDVLDRAERIQATLAPGTIWVSEATHRLVDPLFTWASRDDTGYQPLARRPQAGKGRGLAGLSSPLVGRDAELHALQEAVERLRAGIGGIVTVVGEAGIGKSRLVAELKRSAIGDQPSADLSWIEGRCLSYATGSAYQMWRDMLHAWLDAPADAAPEVVVTTLRERVRAVCPEAFNDVYPFLAWLLSLPLDEVATTRLRGIDAEGLQTLTFRAVANLFDCAARQKPLALVCEDLHWADAASLALLEHLLPLTDRVPLLFVCLFRPERELGCWHIREVAARTYEHCHTDVHLKALSEADGTRLVSNLLAGDVLSQDLRTSILERTEGNPFYVEEMIRSLIDDAVIAYDAAAGQWRVIQAMAAHTPPDTLYGLLMARIDRLPVGAKRVLQLASVIGRIFSYPLLAAIAERSTLDAHLVTLLRAQMIRERARVPERTFIFHHQFTLEAAYGDLLRRTRRVLHRRVAETLETLYPERIEGTLGLLAYHWEQAEDAGQAAIYLQRAGEQAAAQFANAEAVDYLSRALSLTPVDAQADRYALLSTRASVYDVQGRYDLEAQDLDVLAALAAALDADDPQPGKSRQAAVAIRQAMHAIRMVKPKALVIAQEAVRLAQAAQDVACEAAGYREWGRAIWYQGDNYQALVPLEQALILARKAQLHQVQIDTLHSIGNIYGEVLADPVKAQVYYDQELRICQETGNRKAEGEAQRDVGWTLQKQGKPEQALPHLERALQLCRATGDRRNEGWALLALGRTQFSRGQYAEGEAYCEQALAIFHAIKELVAIGQTSGVLVGAALEQERPEKALAYQEREVQTLRKEGNRVAEARQLESTGSFLVFHGAYTQAQSYLEQALPLGQETGDPWGVMWTLWDFGLLYFRQGDLDRAQAFTEQSLRREGVVESLCLVMLSLIAHWRGDDDTAQAYGQQALRLSQAIGFTSVQGSAWRVLGDAATSLCHWDEATRAYTQSMGIWRSLNNRRFSEDRTAESQAGLARVALAQGDTAAALTHAETISRYLEAHPTLHHAFEPLRVYLTCYQALSANGDRRAQDILRAAYSILQERAANIEDESLRRSYLENVPYHREIVAEWERIQKEGHV